MSNHTGSYLLNEVIELLHEEEVFELLGRGKSQGLIIKMVRLATRDYDCNAGEILEDHASWLKLCYCCLSPATKLKHGRCAKCRM